MTARCTGRVLPGVVAFYRKGESVDMLTVFEELKIRNTLEMAGGRSYIAQLSSMVPSTANAAQYAKIVSEKALLRSLINASSEIMEQAYQATMEPEEVLDQAEQAVFKIAQTRQKRDFEALKEDLYANLNRIDEVAKMEGGLTGPYYDLSASTSTHQGCRNTILIILAARAQHGNNNRPLRSGICQSRARLKSETTQEYLYPAWKPSIGTAGPAAPSMEARRLEMRDHFETGNWNARIGPDSLRGRLRPNFPIRQRFT